MEEEPEFQEDTDKDIYATNLTPEENEELFQKLWDLYWHQETTKAGQKRQSDRMWYSVYFCCSNLAKKLLKGVKAPDFEGKVMDATIKCMEQILRGVRPSKLSSFCYWPIFGIIYDRKLQKEERTISYEAWQEFQYASEKRNAK